MSGSVTFAGTSCLVGSTFRGTGWPPGRRQGECTVKLLQKLEVTTNETPSSLDGPGPRTLPPA